MMNAVGMEWVMPGLPRMWIREGRCLFVYLMSNQQLRSYRDRPQLKPHWTNW